MGGEVGVLLRVPEVASVNLTYYRIPKTLTNYDTTEILPLAWRRVGRWFKVATFIITKYKNYYLAKNVVK